MSPTVIASPVVDEVQPSTFPPVEEAQPSIPPDKPLAVEEVQFNSFLHLGKGAFPPDKALAVEEAQRVIPLLKDYEEKLHELSKRAYHVALDYLKNRPGLFGASAGALIRQSEFDGLKQRFKLISPAAMALARVVSPMVEYGKHPVYGNLDRVTLLELKLRLADFEHSLLTAEEDMKSLSEKMK